ncbi:GPN loop GTPase 1 [Echinococcus multilocularis]|uniref:GPN-loop GTPase n=1 Tax=Echinococcus multilocularis TaxID=6211 RepID=A0A068YJR4_ECHMU|nr:GPN loop GTPase 1 [Echinococcus multilocularis]
MASTANNVESQSPTCIIVLGMAGSGKSTFVKKLVEHLTLDENSQPYTINLDPAVYHLPYYANIDIRDTVKFKEVMKQYGFGPNGAIMTSLNFFSTRFDQVLNLINKNACRYRYVVFDTPGQIEVFTWSASGVIITEALAASYPTLVVYVLDTPRSHNPVTFMSNMLYACSVLYRMQLPFICVFNKTDIIECDFAMEWMQDFEAFQRALDAQRSAVLDGVDGVDGPLVDCDSSQYMTSLTSSMALVLDEFYNDLKSCGVSSVSGDGMPRFLELVKDAIVEYYNEYLPELQAKNVSRKYHKSLLTRKCGDVDDERGSAVDSDDDEEDVVDEGRGRRCVRPMLVDLVGHDDNADSDPLVHLDGVEQKPDDVDQIDDETFQKKCTISPSVQPS